MSDRVEQAAAEWALRHPLDPAGEAQIEAWLAEDPGHAGALLRAMAGLSLVDQAIAPRADRIEPARPSSEVRRRFLAGAGVALAASITGLFGWHYWRAQHVETARGEIRRLPLADGSVAMINTDSALSVALERNIRRISLDHGQAWFQVAKDRARPFVVDAGIALVRAVGTAFSVERRDQGVIVAVTEGTVAVWAANASGAMTIIDAGQFARFHAGAATPVVGTAPAAITRALAWRSGEIALENETVSNAVAQFNRYNRQQLVIEDQQLAHARLIGLFQIDKPGDFAATLATSFDAQVTTTPQEIRIARKKAEAR
ncbi:FecR family protein [Sphingomonas azotifigens]|uniref:FecR family protein n=1 Tax=Sphingomonas azotifigens TaxID=330920 RepID=UPI000A03867C|nr:FecR domain-containing protein [Sphingomonas azotifigens]